MFPLVYYDKVLQALHTFLTTYVAYVCYTLEKEILSFGPLCVVPKWQGCGVGEILLTETLKLAKEAGYEGVVIIGADTVVSKDGEIMGKPADEEDAFNMLKKLQGDKHMVSTGVALIVIKNGTKEMISFAEDTDVNMYEMSEEEINDYIATKEPMDKAGSYGIQGLGAKFISGISGDYNNVVGLPIGSIYQALRKLSQAE